MPSHILMEAEWAMLGPLLALTIAGCLVLLTVFLPEHRARDASFLLAITGLGAALGLTAGLFNDRSRLSTFGDMLVMDRPSLFITGVILVAAILGVLLSRQYLARAPAPPAEYYALVLFAALGMVIMAATNNLLVMFLGLEVLSVALYVLAGITRDWPRALEASMKYFLLGAFSTGFILYGMAFLYGASGTLDLMEIGHRARELQGSAAGSGGSGTAAASLLLGLGLILVGLGFKVAAVPFHWWAPDVYEGAPTPVTAFMAVGTKAAAFLAMLRVVVVAFGDVLVSRWTGALVALALVTMVGGNFVALAQRNVKRLLAWSSIAHAGYLLVAVATASDLGTSALLFYFASYAATTVGAFGVASVVAETGIDGDEGYGILRYAGLGHRRPILALAMSLFMLSLTGIPPTSGFVAKYFVFQAAMQKAVAHTDAGRPVPGDPTFLWLAVIGILASVVSAAYYLRVIVTMYMREPEDDPAAATADATSGVAVALAASAVLLLGLWPSPVYDLTRHVYSALQSLAMVLAP